MNNSLKRHFFLWIFTLFICGAKYQKAGKEISINLIETEYLKPLITITGKPSLDPKSFTLIYDDRISEEGATLTFNITGKFNREPISNFVNNLRFTMSEMKAQKNYLLQKKGRTISSKEFNICPSVLGSDGISLQVNCPGFRPIVSQFILTVSIETEGRSIVSQEFLFEVVRPDSYMRVNLDNGTAISNINYPSLGCGLHGSLQQRMFDCSMVVKNFGQRVIFGTSKRQGKTTSYIAGSNSVDSTWFLVSCPILKLNVGSYNCAWLAPVLTSGNPALNRGGFDTFGAQPLSVVMNVYSGKRFLWSGVLEKPYDFCQANQGDSLSSCSPFNALIYDQYGTSSMTGPAVRISQGLHSDFNKSVCQREFFTAKELSKTWQIPSYSMLYTLTGGGINCKPGYENSTCTNSLGFNAKFVPGFGNINNFGKGLYSTLWSSSFFGNLDDSWAFVESGMLGDNEYIVNESLAVRCVTSI